jgi:hypothetical protein
MYMTAGKASYEKKKRHNLSQLHRWLRVWKRGEILSGHARGKKQEIAYKDVDHVIGLSIIDSGEPLCEYHAKDVQLAAERKLSACATITDSVLREFVGTGGGPRDLVRLLDFMQRNFSAPLSVPSVRITESSIISFIQNKVAMDAMAVRQEFSRLPGNPDRLSDAWLETLDLFHFMKSRVENDQAISDLASDLMGMDIVWLTMADASLSRAVTPPDQAKANPDGAAIIGATRKTGVYTLQYFVSATSAVAKERNVIGMAALNQPGLTCFSSLDFGPHAPLRILTARRQTGPSMLEQEVEALRERVLQ